MLRVRDIDFSSSSSPGLDASPVSLLISLRSPFLTCSMIINALDCTLFNGNVMSAPLMEKLAASIAACRLSWDKSSTRSGTRGGVTAEGEMERQIEQENE